LTTHLLDSDWTIDYFHNKNHAVARLRPLIDARSLATSIVVYAELHEGFIDDPEAGRKLREYRELVDTVPVIGIDVRTAEFFASVRRELRLSGMLISDNDLWIASTALRHDLTLISRDKAFDRIPNLKLLR
jgi:predicted nucleic acid-binding protein